jgi:uncharacterized membrane protein YhaH (DUF805 family)
MDAKQYFLMPFKKVLDFKSKTNIKDFWLGALFLAIVVICLALIGLKIQNIVSSDLDIAIGAICGIVILFALVALYALGARRLNDRGDNPHILWAIPIANILPIVSINYFESLFYLFFLIKIYIIFHFLYLFCTNTKDKNGKKAK